MALPNIVALLLLSGVVARETKKYLWSNQLDMHMDDVVPERLRFSKKNQLTKEK